MEDVLTALEIIFKKGMKMSEPKFTPGPWSILFSDKTKVVLEKGGVAIFVADTYSGFVRSKEEQEANATLIAVAPEMHEELNNICLMCQRGEIEVEYTSLRLNGDCENCRIGKILKKVG